jgi:hypothetical protein
VKATLESPSDPPVLLWVQVDGCWRYEGLAYSFSILQGSLFTTLLHNHLSLGRIRGMMSYNFFSNTGARWKESYRIDEQTYPSPSLLPSHSSPLWPCLWLLLHHKRAQFKSKACIGSITADFAKPPVNTQYGSIHVHTCVCVSWTPSTPARHWPSRREQPHPGDRDQTTSLRELSTSRRESQLSSNEPFKDHCSLSKEY